jgi:hypothetical protein
MLICTCSSSLAYFRTQIKAYHSFNVHISYIRIAYKHNMKCYIVFHRFRKAKFAYSGSVLSSSQFSILPQLPQKMKLASKVVKIDPKIIVSLPKIQIPETHCRKSMLEREGCRYSLRTDLLKQ